MHDTPRYLPEPGGDLVLHVDRHALRVVRVLGEQLRFVLELPIDEDLPTVLPLRLRDTLRAYAPERLLVSVAQAAREARWRGRLTHDVLAAARGPGLPVLEIPDVVVLARALGGRRGEGLCPTSPSGLPPAPPAPAADPPARAADPSSPPYVPPAVLPLFA